jgi:hypothetical protein
VIFLWALVKQLALAQRLEVLLVAVGVMLVLLQGLVAPEGRYQYLRQAVYLICDYL